jgi:ABC-type glycerol-3-phosphate transport system permease component
MAVKHVWRLQIPRYLALAYFSLIFLVPIFWTVSSSFKSLENTLTNELIWLPKKLHVENYVRVWGKGNFGRFFLNSTIVAVLVTGGHLLLASMAGYGLAKFRFRGRGIIFTFILSTMMVPIQVLVVPLFIIVRTFGWINTYAGLIVPAMLTAFGVFLMRQYMLTIPNELINAARIDGCRELRIFFQIILPLAKPGAGALAILIFLGTWNNLLWPLVVVNSDRLFTLPLGLVRLAKSEHGVKFNELLSAAVISSAPVVVFFLLFQRFYIDGLTVGSIKG